jgi:hypothetical protein
MTHAALKIEPTIELASDDNVRAPLVDLPTISDAAREYIAAEIAATGQGLEAAFVCCYDLPTKVITSAKLVMRGSTDSLRCIQSDLRPGEVYLHGHPTGCPLWPSEPDLDCAQLLGARGIGFAICEPTAELIYMVREPLPLRIDRSRWRWFSIGRLTLGWDRGRASTSTPR